MRVEKKDDGLHYAYKYRIVARENILNDEFKSIGAEEWKVYNSHYDRQSIYKRCEEYIENQYNQYYAVAVEVFEDGHWIVDINWLEKYMDNNRHRITRI